MLKDLFLAPGRLLTILLSRDKKKSYRGARGARGGRSSAGLGIVLPSLAAWLILAGLVLYTVDKFGLLNRALDVGVEVTTNSENRAEPEPAPTPVPPVETGSATGTLTPDSAATAPLPIPAAPAASDQPAVKIEQWLVIFHSIPKKSGREEAERRQAQYRSRGLNVEILDNNAFPRLKGGDWWIVAQGPFDTQAAAQAAADKAKKFTTDFMIRRGL